MALITDAIDTWSTPVTLGADEIWQCREGGVFLTTTASPTANDGVLLRPGEAMHISSGLSVAYRSSGYGDTVIAREAV